MLIKWGWRIILFERKKGNPIQLILLLIRYPCLFYPCEKRKGKKRNNFPTKSETTRRQVEKALNLDFDNRTKIEPVIKRFISSRPYRTISNTNNRSIRPCSTGAGGERRRESTMKKEKERKKGKKGRKNPNCRISPMKWNETLFPVGVFQ